MSVRKAAMIGAVPRLTLPAVIAVAAVAMGASLLLPSTAAAAGPWEYPGDVTLGSEEVVFDWTTERCENDDIPDAPARGFVDVDGNIQIIAGHFVTYRMLSTTTLSALAKDCSQAVFTSDDDTDPSKHNDNEWIIATYTIDGQNVYALVHNEFHGDDAGMCTTAGVPTTCWYNTITFASSTDKGVTYNHATAPNHFVMTVPYQYQADVAPFGMFSGSNIIKSPKDNLYYRLVQVEAYNLQQVGVCATRTADPSDPTSWRAWDGTGYNVQFVDPYAGGITPSDHICEPISPNGAIEQMNDSLTYNTYFDKYMLIGTASQGGGNYGFYYSLSDDLINWTTRKLIVLGNLLWSPPTPGDIIAYPSLIDPDDTSGNFSISDQSAYLYYTRWDKTAPDDPVLDRDLVRVSIDFSKLIVSGFTINRRGDQQDKTIGDGICTTGGGTTCGLRSAIEESNARPYYYRNEIFPITTTISVANKTINPTTPYPSIVYPVSINGYTETGASENTAAFGQAINAVPIVQVDGSATNPGTVGLNITAGSSTISGLTINNYTTAISISEKGGNTIAGVFIGTDTGGTTSSGAITDGIVIDGVGNNTVGGTSTSSRNLILGAVVIKNAGASNNVVKGNYIGTDAAGTTLLGSGGSVEIQAGASNNTVGGDGEGNLIVRGGLSSVILEGGADNNTVQGNLIGSDVKGTAELGNHLLGISIQNGASNNQIGGPSSSLGAGNLIVGALEEGVFISGVTSTGNIIEGNFIGTDVGGSIDLGNTNNGILIANSAGDHEIKDNTIAFNGQAGIALLSNAGTNTSMLGNEIYSNGQLGIDLEFNGVNFNDPGDSDSSVNNLQNYPSIDFATSSSILIAGTLNSLTSTQFRLEFFSNSSCDGSGYGEGENYLGFVDVTTDGSGNATFFLPLESTVPVGHYITATATDPNDNTSEFSECQLVVSGAADIADVSVTKTDMADPVNEGDYLVYVAVVVNNGPNDAQNVVLTDTLPGTVTFVSTTPSTPTCTESGGTVTCNLGTMVAGATTSVVILVMADQQGDLTNNVSVTSDTSDSNVPNNSASEVTTVSPPASADLEVTKIAHPNPANIGQPLLYEINIYNAGPSDSQNVLLADVLLGTYSFISSTPSSPTCTESGGTVTCNLGTVTSGTTSTVWVLVVPGVGMYAIDSAHATSTTGDPFLANNSSRLVVMIDQPIGVPGMTAWGLVVAAMAFGGVLWMRRRSQARPSA